MLRKSILWLLFILVSAGLSGCVSHHMGPINVDDYSSPIKVACVGDSITFGSGIPDRDVNSYPAQLGRRLGQKWDVRNFGVSGATLLKKGDKPYWNTGAFNNARNFMPDVVIIKLGTNDTKPQNWQHKRQFAGNYLEMINIFRAVNKDVHIWLCLPVPAFPERWGIRDSVIKDELVPIIQQLATQEDLPTIDLYKALHGRADLFPDKIHPNTEGASIMTYEIYKSLVEEPEKNFSVTVKESLIWQK